MAIRRSARNLAGKAETKTARKSGRKYKTSPMPPPGLPLTHGSFLRDANGYLQRIYTAVDQIYRRGRTKPNTPHLVTNTIIRARCAQALTDLSCNGRAAYIAAIARASPSLGGRAKAIAKSLQKMGQEDITRQRFSAFVDRFGFLLLSVCAYSKSFRFLLENVDLSNRNRGLWRDLSDLIESHAHSIELYACTRGLDWNTPLAKGSHDWNQLICRSLRDILDEHSTFTETPVLSISDAEYRMRHELPEKVGHYHEWVVSSEYRTAYNPELTYRTTKGKNSRLVTERQLNIDASVVLDKPVWVNRKQWPVDDPRYRGPLSDACEVCLEVTDHATLTREDCGHTLDNLCAVKEGGIRNGNIAKASSRVELLQYPGRGIGVRALKAFRAGEIMAEYVGEIYPEYVIKKDGKNRVSLYPNNDGITYKFHQAMEDRVEERRKSTSPDNESKSMIIDPAIKGNWTRYMNHSCRGATEFVYRFVGDKKLPIVIATRDIQFGEEVTVDYGAGYWKDLPYACACEEDRCKLWDAGKNKVAGSNKITWAEEKERRQLGSRRLANRRSVCLLTRARN
jgi:SET domain